MISKLLENYQLVIKLEKLTLDLEIWMISKVILTLSMKDMKQNMVIFQKISPRQFN